MLSEDARQKALVVESTKQGIDRRRQADLTASKAMAAERREGARARRQEAESADVDFKATEAAAKDRQRAAFEARKRYYLCPLLEYSSLGTYTALLAPVRANAEASAAGEAHHLEVIHRVERLAVLYTIHYTLYTIHYSGWQCCRTLSVCLRWETCQPARTPSRPRRCRGLGGRGGTATPRQMGSLAPARRVQRM
jgi:hypothetical protein